MDALLQRAERDAPIGVAHDDLAVEHVAPGGESELGEVAVERCSFRERSSTSSPSTKAITRNPSHFGSYASAPGSSGSPLEGRASIGAIGGDRGSVTVVQYPGST